MSRRDVRRDVFGVSEGRLAWRRVWSPRAGSDCWVVARPPPSWGETGDCPLGRRCYLHALRGGFGAVWILFLSPSPDLDPSGPPGVEWEEGMVGVLSEASRVVLAWGRRGHLSPAAACVLRELEARGTTPCVLGVDRRGGWPLPPAEASLSVAPQPVLSRFAG